MVKKIRVKKKRKKVERKLEPPLPELRAELNLPKYFKKIHGGNYRVSGEKNLGNLPPPPIPRTEETPRTIPRMLVKGEQEAVMPVPAPEAERVPLLMRMVRRFRTMIGLVEADRPEQMSRMPESDSLVLTRGPLGESESGKSKLEIPGSVSETEKVPQLPFTFGLENICEFRRIANTVTPYFFLSSVSAKLFPTKGDLLTTLNVLISTSGSWRLKSEKVDDSLKRLRNIS